MNFNGGRFVVEDARAGDDDESVGNEGNYWVGSPSQRGIHVLPREVEGVD